MRHANRSSKLGVKKGHRAAMMRNLTLGLIEHGRIKTTVARAKRLRTFVEPLVTRLKSDPTLHDIRMAESQLANKDAVTTLLKEIAPKFKTRPGGYTRILKLAGARAGDAAEMALIEWVDESLVGAYQEAPKAKAGKKTAAKKASAKAASAEGEGTEKSEKPKKKATAKKAAKDE